MIPSPVMIDNEMVFLEQRREDGESRTDDAFMAGMQQALKWVLGKGASPTEYIRMCDRVDARH